MTDNPLTTLRQDIETHWREHRPGMVAELEAAGTLAEAIEAAATQTENAVLEAVSQGTDFWQAWDLYRQQWAFLPAEEADAAAAGYGPADEAWWVVDEEEEEETWAVEEEADQDE
jgi:hypothetical protein